jgi:DNA-binding CsgD family transcriptional regulator
MHTEMSQAKRIFFDAAAQGELDLPTAHNTWRGPERRADTQQSPSWFSLILDELDYGMILLDCRLKVQFANRAALAQLSTLRLLVVEQGELTAIEPRDMIVLGAAIRSASTQRLRRMVMLGTETDRIAVAVVPVPQNADALDTRVLVLLSRPQICEALSVYGFARDHGLSSAESQVLKALCEGLQPSEIASQQGVAISTVRTQISNIRLKTDASSIRELVQRVARLPPIRSALRDEFCQEAVAT